MLTLAESVQLGNFSIYRDVRFDAGSRSVTSRFYAVAVAPRLARDDDAGPAFRFLRYRELVTAKDAPPELRGGGVVTVVLDLSPNDAEQAALREQIAAHYKLPSARGIELFDLPVKSGQATLSFAGDTAPTADAFGVAQTAAVAGLARVCFAMPVSIEGAALLGGALDRGAAVLFASLGLDMEYILDGISLHVWCDAKRAYETATSLAKAGQGGGPAALSTQLVSMRAAGIDIETTTALPADEAVKLYELGESLLTAALAATIIRPPDTDDPSNTTGTTAPIPPDTHAELTLNHTFTMTFPATRRITVDGGLPIQLTAAQRESSIADVSLSGSSILLEVTALCTVDFATALVDSVHVRVTYDASTADGHPFHRETDFLLRAATPRQVFRFDASPTQRTYAWGATVTYKDGTVIELPARKESSTILVIEIGQLGVLAVDLALGDVPLAVVSRVIVQLELPSRGVDHQLLLDGATPTSTWQVIVGADDPGPYRYRVSWLLADGRRVEDDARTSTARRVFLAAPRDLVQSSTVLAIAAADFTDVAQVLVELRPSADRAAERALLSFTEAGKPQSWTFAAQPNTPLAYQARRSVTQRDGTTAQFDYTNEDSPILVVRDVSRFAVQVIARLLDLGGAYTVALLTIASDDAAPPVQDTLALRDRTESPIWTMHLASPANHKYRYQLTLVAKDGTRRVGNWVDADEEILVLRLPAE